MTTVQLVHDWAPRASAWSAVQVMCRACYVLRTMRETALAENDPIDDQAEWLDNKHVLCGNDNTVWQVPADGSGHPTKLLTCAYSPAVVRIG
jgi:hypothetical protein